MAQFSHAEAKEKNNHHNKSLGETVQLPKPKMSERTTEQTNKQIATDKQKKAFRILFFTHSR